MPMRLAAFLADWAQAPRRLADEEIRAHPHLSEEHKQLLIDRNHEGLRQALEAEGHTSMLPAAFSADSWL